MIDIGPTEKSTLRVMVYQATKQYTTNALLALLEDGSSIVRSAVARELQIRGGTEVFLHAKELLGSKRGATREIAAFLLGQIGTPKLPFKRESVPLLESALKLDPAPEVREAAAAALGHLGSRHSILGLVQAARDPNAGVRVACAASLGRFVHDARALKALTRLSKDADSSVREWARLSLYP